MNVSGIRPYSGFYQYNSIKLDELRNQQIADTQPAGPLEAADAQSEEERRRQKEQEEVQHIAVPDGEALVAAGVPHFVDGV